MNKFRRQYPFQIIFTFQIRRTKLTLSMRCVHVSDVEWGTRGEGPKASVRKYPLHTMTAKHRIPDKNRGTCKYREELERRFVMQFYFAL